MTTCPKCGEEIKNEQTNHCPNCGATINDNGENSSNQASNEATIRLKKIVPWAIGGFIIILLIIVFVLLKNFNSPDAQAKILINAIDNDDSQKVATMLTTRDNKVDETEAQTYIKYIKKEVGMTKFIFDIRETVEKLNKSETRVAAYLQTRAGENVLRVSKNGRRYLIFNNMSFTPPTKEVTVKPKEDTKYEFKDDGRNKKVVAEADKETTIGKFIPGNYAIDAKKITDNGVFTGYLKFDFKYANSNTVDVNEDFNEAKVHVKIKNGEQLSRSSLKVKINDRTWDYGNAKVYGPYPKNKDITVSATGKVKGKTFETETKSIKADKLTDNTDVTVSFDDDDISDYIEKKEKEDNSLKNKLGSFFSSYSLSLNQAIAQSDFSLVHSFLKKGSSSYDKVRKNIASNTSERLVSPIILSVDQTGDTIKAKVQGFGLNGLPVVKNYVLEESKDDLGYKLVKVD